MKSFIISILFISVIFFHCMAQDSIIYPAIHGTYQRYEFCVSLPDTPVNFKSEIDSFLAKPSWPIPNTNTIDPYDPKQIKVVAVFTSPTNQSYTRYGFFFQDVSVNGNGFNPPVDDAYPFRIRFAPPNTGTWKVSIFLYMDSGINQIGKPFHDTFSVKVN